MRLLDRRRLTERGAQPKILFRGGRLLDTGRLLEEGLLLHHLRYLVKTSMELKNILTLQWGVGGGAQSNGFGLVLLCNSGKKVLAKTFGFTFGV